MAVLPLVLFGLLIGVLAVGLHHTKGAQHAAMMPVGAAVPHTDIPLVGSVGGDFTTQAWRGRPYIVHFFSSWSKDSKTEQEELMTLAASHIPMIGVIFKDTADHAGTYLDRAGNPFAAVALDEGGRASLAWGVTEGPTTFLIDAEGILRWAHTGPLTNQVVTDELMPAWENADHGS